jgi:hypothetical protein
MSGSMTFNAIKGRAASAVRLVCLLGAFLMLSPGAFAQTQAPAFTPKEEAPEQFPDFPNREDTFYMCSACHAFGLVAQQGMSRGRWDGIIDQMSERHGMAKLDGKERAPLLDYLEKAFPEKAQEGGGWQNPFLKK